MYFENQNTQTNSKRVDFINQLKKIHEQNLKTAAIYFQNRARMNVTAEEVEIVLEHYNSIKSQIKQTQLSETIGKSPMMFRHMLKEIQKVNKRRVNESIDDEWEYEDSELNESDFDMQRYIQGKPQADEIKKAHDYWHGVGMDHALNRLGPQSTLTHKPGYVEGYTKADKRLQSYSEKSRANRKRKVNENSSFHSRGFAAAILGTTPDNAHSQFSSYNKGYVEGLQSKRKKKGNDSYVDKHGVTISKKTIRAKFGKAIPVGEEYLDEWRHEVPNDRFANHEVAKKTMRNHGIDPDSYDPSEVHTTGNQMFSGHADAATQLDIKTAKARDNWYSMQQRHKVHGEHPRWEQNWKKLPKHIQRKINRAGDIYGDLQHAQRYFNDYARNEYLHQIIKPGFAYDRAAHQRRMRNEGYLGEDSCCACPKGKRRPARSVINGKMRTGCRNCGKVISESFDVKTGKMDWNKVMKEPTRKPKERARAYNPKINPHMRDYARPKNPQTFGEQHLLNESTMDGTENSDDFAYNDVYIKGMLGLA